MDQKQLEHAIDRAQEGRSRNPIATYFYGLRQKRIERAWHSCLAGDASAVRAQQVLAKYDVQSLAFVERQMRASTSAAINLGFKAILELVGHRREHDRSLGWEILGLYQQHSDLHSDTRNAYVFALAERVKRLNELRYFAEKVLQNLNADQQSADTRVDEVSSKPKHVQ